MGCSGVEGELPKSPDAPDVPGPGFRVQGSGFRVQGAGCRVQDEGLGLGVAAGALLRSVPTRFSHLYQPGSQAVKPSRFLYQEETTTHE